MNWNIIAKTVLDPNYSIPQSSSLSFSKSIPLKKPHHRKSIIPDEQLRPFQLKLRRKSDNLLISQKQVRLDIVVPDTYVAQHEFEKTLQKKRRKGAMIKHATVIQAMNFWKKELKNTLPQEPYRRTIYSIVSPTMIPRLSKFPFPKSETPIAIAPQQPQKQYFFRQMNGGTRQRTKEKESTLSTYIANKTSIITQRNQTQSYSKLPKVQPYISSYNTENESLKKKIQAKRKLIHISKNTSQQYI